MSDPLSRHRSSFTTIPFPSFEIDPEQNITQLKGQRPKLVRRLILASLFDLGDLPQGKPSLRRPTGCDRRKGHNWKSAKRIARENLRK